MADVPTIIGIIILVVVILAILKIVKKMIKAVAIISGLVFVILIVGTYLVYLDLNDIKENLGEKQSIFVYEDNEGVVLTGFYNVVGKDEEAIPLSADAVNSFREKSLDEIKNGYYKIFIFKQEAFDPVEAIEDFSGVKVNRVDSIYLIQSDNFDEDVQKTNLKDFSYDGAEQFKGILFAALYEQGAKDDKIFLFKQHKRGNADIYPETIVFRIIKSTPDFLIDKIIKVEG